MKRLVFILIVVTTISLGITWIADEPGNVLITWGNYEIKTSLLAMLSGAALFVLACTIVYYIFYSLLVAPRTWQRSRLYRRQQLGLEALTGTFAAIGAQDIRSARKQIASAQKYLPHQPLTLMLSSQLARLEGNESQSRLYLEQMLKDESTEFLALRGLIENARHAHDDDAALAHAEKALKLKAHDPWLITTLVGLYTGKRRSDEALRLIDKAARKRTISKQEQRTLASGVLYEQARILVEERRFEIAVESLTQALRYKPDLTSASALLAECYYKEGETVRALKIISGAWKIAPHPLLTQVLLQCFERLETRRKTIRAAEGMVRMHPKNLETRFLRAVVALKEGHTDIARNELKLLIDTRETVRACTLMAEAESASGDNAQSSHWLKRAQSALSDPGYVCESCHQSTDSWRLACPHCATVGSIAMAH